MSGLLIVIIAMAVFMELAFTLHVYSNFRYAMKKYKRERFFRPSCVVIVPCKGLDTAFEDNIQSFYRQAYPGPYQLWFVVEDKSDAAFAVLAQLKDRFLPTSKVADVRILVAGKTAGCSQKLHNLLFAYRQVPQDTEVLIFADSDACAGPDWLIQLAAPLRKPHIGLASGYRWFVPTTNNLATLALSAMNAKVFQVMGNTRFNLAWGGSMSIRKKDFDRLEIERIWSHSLSDDLSISRAVRTDGLMIRFVPACVVASYGSTTWAALWEFARRQFIITRIYSPRMWCFALVSAIYSVVGLWGSLALAVWAIAARPAFWSIPVAAGAVFLLCQVYRAAQRQELAARLLPKDQAAMRPARWADWLGFWAWGLVMLAVIVCSAWGRTIIWRGIGYRINEPMDIDIIPQN